MSRYRLWILSSLIQLTLLSVAAAQDPEPELEAANAAEHSDPDEDASERAIPEEDASDGRNPDVFDTVPSRLDLTGFRDALQLQPAAQELLTQALADSAAADRHAAAADELRARSEREAALSLRTTLQAGEEVSDGRPPTYQLNTAVDFRFCDSPIDISYPSPGINTAACDPESPAVGCEVSIPRGARFRVVSADSTIVRVRVLPLNDDPNRVADASRTWCAEIESVAPRVTVYRSRIPRFEFGTLLVPLKIRLGGGRVEWGRTRSGELIYGGPRRRVSASAEVTIGAGLGMRLDINDDWSTVFVAAGGIGYSDVPAESGTEQRAIFSVATGIAVEYQRVSLGVFTGVDLLGDGNNLEWAEHGFPWLGLVLGTRIWASERPEATSSHDEEAEAAADKEAAAAAAAADEAAAAAAAAAPDEAAAAAAAAAADKAAAAAAAATAAEQAAAAAANERAEAAEVANERAEAAEVANERAEAAAAAAEQAAAAATAAANEKAEAGAAAATADRE